jgi:hypothetical protein
VCRYIRVQQSANPNIESCLVKRRKRETVKWCLALGRTWPVTSSRSASRPSPSSPSGPYGIGSVSSRTSIVVEGHIPYVSTVMPDTGSYRA